MQPLKRLALHNRLQNITSLLNFFISQGKVAEKHVWRRSAYEER